MSNRYRSKLLVSTLLAGAAFAVTPAGAQTVRSGTADAPPTPAAQDSATQASVAPAAGAENQVTSTNDVVVTGTLIRNPNLTSSSPVNVINEAAITLRAPNSAEEILREIPGVVPGIGSQVNNGNGGISTVNLRGLGTQRNLVLLDGNRLVPSDASGRTDLDIIPIALLQRVDVLTGGASTTYGADAVSGVVNFITRRDFTGIDLRAKYGIPQTGDGKSYRVDLTLGANFADDKGNAVLNLSYTSVDPVYQTAGFSNFGISSTSGRASGSSFTSVPTTISFPSGDSLQVNPAATALVPQYQGFNFNPYNIFQTPLDRKSAYAAARYDVADGVEVYGRALFAQNTVQTIIAPSGIFGLGFTIPGNNPYLTPTIRNQICTEDGIALGATCDTNPAIPLPAVYRRAVEVGPRIENFQNTTYDARAGVRWDITHSLNLDVNGSYGRNETIDTRSGYVLNTVVQQALNANNTATCTVTTGGCVPLNLFGPAGSISPAQVAFIQGQSTTRVVTELKQVRAVFSGDLGYTVPFAANPISFAAGGEYRNYTYQRIPDILAQNPSALGGAGGAVLPFSGSYSVKEGFGELIAPIASGHRFFNEVELEGGIRYSSYNIPGGSGFNTTTYKGGAKFQPVEGVAFRGIYQHALRAPNIGELFAPNVTGLTNLTVDPCAGAAPTTNANLAAVCVAQGAPAATIGKIPNPSGGQPNETSGGNLNLKPEIADTYTLGVVLTPARYVRGFNLSIDYYNIVINGAITTPTVADVLSPCFNNLTAASATSAACTGIRRNPVNGALSGPAATTFGIPLPLSNLGRLQTDGIDLVANYQRTLGVANLNLSFAGNYTRHNRFAADAGSFNRDCTGYYSSNCGPGGDGQIQPKFTFQQRTTLTAGPASLSLLWRYLNPVDYEGTAPDYIARGFTATNRYLFNGVVTNAAGANSALAGQSLNFNHIPAYHYFDLSAQFNVTPAYQLTIGVLNLTNRQPPVVGGQAGTTSANSGNTFPSTYDPIGRQFTATLRLKF